MEMAALADALVHIPWWLL